MKTTILFAITLTLLCVATPAFGQQEQHYLSDATGLVNRMDVQTGGHNFEVQSTANFDIPDYTFDKDEKKLTLFITSGLENNLGELHIPQTLLSGDLTFYLNNVEYFPKVVSNEKISFVTLNFTGSGDNKLDIFGTVYLSGLAERAGTSMAPDKTIQKQNTFDDSINWMILAGSLAFVTVAVLVVIRLKKKK